MKTAAPFISITLLVVAPLLTQDPATFRATTRLIIQTVTVKDKDGKAVEGLTAKDFTITEDGEPQTISLLDFQRLEGTSGPEGSMPQATVLAPRQDQPGVPSVTDVPIATPPPGDARYRDRRLLMLYFDVPAMPGGDQLRAYSSALRFIDTEMHAPDLVALMTFQNGAVVLKQDFTDDRARLRETIAALMDAGQDRGGVSIDAGSAFGQDDAEFSIFSTDRQLAALQTAVTMLRPLPEQTSFVYFASGLNLNGVDNMAQLRATTNAAIQANVTIFPVDARGLVATPPLGDATRPSPGGLGMFTGQLAQAAMTTFQRSQDSFYSLAKDTGGRALIDSNDLSQGIVQAAEAQTSYYILGYYSTHLAPDGRYRRVRITLNGGRSADLSYRPGYFADKVFSKFTTADKERQLEEALMLDNPVTEMTMAMEVNYFELNGAEYFVPVAVKIPGRELALARRGGASHTVIDFIGEVKDGHGVTIRNMRDKLDIKLSDQAADQLGTHPIQYESGFTLLPDSYVIKVLARDAETGRIGTYQRSFVVPNLVREEQRVPTSSVVLSSQRVAVGGALYTVQQNVATGMANPLVSDGQQLLPSVTRVFSRTRDLYVFLQAYEPGAIAMRPIASFVSFYRGDVKVFETSPLAVTDGMDPKSKAVPLRFVVPLDQLAPGQYTCQVTVLDTTAQKAAFWQAPIVVVQ